MPRNIICTTPVHQPVTVPLKHCPLALSKEITLILYCHPTSAEYQSSERVVLGFFLDGTILDEDANRQHARPSLHDFFVVSPPAPVVM